MSGRDLENLDRTIAMITNSVILIGFLIAGVFLLAFVLKYLWNTTVPEVFGLKEINYWQSFKLLLIGLILFGGFIR